MMSKAEFAYWGADEIAYVRPVCQGNVNGYGVFAADGREVGFAVSYEMAAASVLQHDLYPLSVH